MLSVISFVALNYQYVIGVVAVGNRSECTNARTIEDDFHTAIMQVADQEVESLDDAVSIVRRRYYAIRKGNRIRQGFTIDYADDIQTKEEIQEEGE